MARHLHGVRTVESVAILRRRAVLLLADRVEVAHEVPFFAVRAHVHEHEFRPGDARGTRAEPPGEARDRLVLPEIDRHRAFADPAPAETPAHGALLRPEVPLRVLSVREVGLVPGVGAQLVVRRHTERVRLAKRDVLRHAGGETRRKRSEKAHPREQAESFARHFV